MSESSAARPVSSYQLSRVLPARVLGRGAVVTAGAIMLTAVARVWQAPGWLRTSLVVVAVVLLLLLGLAAIAVVRPPTVLRLDADGFTVRWLRSSGATSGRWRQITDVATRVTRHGAWLLLRHDGGAQTRIPLALLNVPGIQVERDVRERLNAAHGYRRLA